MRAAKQFPARVRPPAKAGPEALVTAASAKCPPSPVATLPAISFSDLAIAPASGGPPAHPSTAVVQRVKTRSQARKEAEEKLKRWSKREGERRKSSRFKPGKYKHGLGKVTVSGIHKQRIAQTSKANYGGETFGSIPPYSKMRPYLNFKGASRSIYDPKYTNSKLSNKQKMAAVLTATTSNISENDKAPGIAKLIRALARRHYRDSSAPHPLDPTVNPAVSTAQEARDLMSGQTPLNTDQRTAIDEYASDSSDDEDETFATRSGMFKNL